MLHKRLTPERLKELQDLKQWYKDEYDRTQRPLAYLRYMRVRDSLSFYTDPLFVGEEST